MRGTLILLLVVAGLGFALWWSERTERDQVDVGPEPVAALDGRSLHDAVAVTLSGSPDAAPVEFAREPGTPWQIVEPVVDVVSRARVEAVFDAFGASQLIPVVTDDEVEGPDGAEPSVDSLRQMGLDAPRAWLTARWADGHQTRFDIGLQGPFGDDVFVRRDGKVWRGEYGLYTALQGTADDWRERYVFGHQAAEARLVVLDRLVLDESGAVGPGTGRERLMLRRAGAEGWRLVEPFDLRLDPGRAETLVGALLSLQVGSFLRGRPGELTGPIDPEAKADVEIQVQGARGSESVSLTRLDGAGQFLGHSATRNLWFLVDSPPYAQAVEVPLQEVRAQYLLTHPVEEARTIRIAGPGEQVVELEREPGGAYRLTRPAALPADPTAANELLGAIRRMFTLRFVEDDAAELERYGLGAAERTTVELLDRRGQPLDVLQLGATASAAPDAERPAGVFVKRADEPHVVEVDREAAALLRRPWTDYADRQILNFESGGAIQRIVCTAGDAERRMQRGDDGLWQVDGAPGALDVGLLEEIAGSLRGLRGDAVAVAREALGDATPDAVIRLLGPTGTVLAELGLHDADDGDWCVLARRPELAYRLGRLTSRNLRLLRPE